MNYGEAREAIQFAEEVAAEAKAIDPQVVAQIALAKATLYLAQVNDRMTVEIRRGNHHR